MFQIGNLPNWAARHNAITANYASKVVSRESNSAPKGAFHWWDIGADGHVGMVMEQRGWVLMASDKVLPMLGCGLGCHDRGLLYFFDPV